MMIRAIKTEQIDFLYYVYAYNKNYEYLADQDDDYADPDEGEEVRHKTFTYDWLIKQILAYKEDNSNELIREMMKWELKTNENILKSLLLNNQDMIAADYGNS
jgi:hypothetical protein